MAPRVRPVGENTRFAEQSHGDVAIGGAGQKAIQGLQNMAQPAGSCVDWEEMTGQGLVPDEGVKAFQRRQPSAQVPRIEYRISAQADGLEQA